MSNCTLEARAWLQHGHAGDPAYRDLLLHVVDWDERPHRGRSPADDLVPEATRLPPAMTEMSGAAERPPCADIILRAGEAAVEARLVGIARRRFLRKMSELQALKISVGPGSRDDRRAVVAAARALGQPHNAHLAEHGARRALEQCDEWPQVAPMIEASGWRPGRGALGSAAGLSLVLATLLKALDAAAPCALARLPTAGFSAGARGDRRTSDRTATRSGSCHPAPRRRRLSADRCLGAMGSTVGCALSAH